MPEKPNIWESFAREDAEYYILTEAVDYSTAEGQAYFFRSGEEFAQASLGKVQHLIPGYGHALEIGCGIGRLSFPHAQRFEQLDVVDIAPTMLEKLRDRATAQGQHNITTHLPDGAWRKNAGVYQYVYSFIVFQHIESSAIIRSYLEAIAHTLHPEGIAQLHFDTRPATPLYRLKNSLPNALLPRAHRKGIRRIRRSPSWLKETFSTFGLQTIEEFHPETDQHFFILRKA